MIISMKKITNRIERQKRIEKLKIRLIELEEDIEDFEILENKQTCEIKTPYTFCMINKLAPQLDFKNSTNRDLALNILSYAKKHNSLISYKDSITIVEYLIFSNKKPKYKSFLKYIEFKKRINNKNCLDK